MQYSSEHSARVRGPRRFDPKTMRSKRLSKSIRVIVGNLRRGNGSMVVQAYRFARAAFTPLQARKWLKDHRVEFVRFDAARGRR